MPQHVNMDVYIEHKPKSVSSWQRTHFSPLAMLQAQGPFVHEATISEDVAAQDMRLRLSDWPVYYTISLAALAVRNNLWTHLPQPGSDRFSNAIVIGDIHCDVTIAAELLATHMTYHLALGFDYYLMYVRANLLEALYGNSMTADYILRGQLLPISLDALQFPSYEEGWAADAAYDPTKLVAYNHAALLLWQEKFHLAVLDIDELWGPRTPLSSVDQWFDTCYPETDLLSVTRLEVICGGCSSSGVSELEHFHQAWIASRPLEVLSNFSHVTNFHPDPKSIFHPDKVGQVWLHKPAAQPRTAVTEVLITSEAELTESCLVVVHLVNLFKSRVGNVPAASSRHQWPEHRRRNRTRVHGIEHV